MKKLVLVFAFLTFSLFLLTACNQNSEESELKDYTEGLVFTLSDDETCYSVSGYTGMDAEVIIPSTYNKKPVTSIGNSAFYWCQSLESVKIPDSVTSIGDDAFYYCASLSRVAIGNSVKSIGSSAFYGCPIQVAILPATAISSIPKEYLLSVGITSGKSIDDYAFSNCSSLTDITIGNSVKSIGSNAFYNCTHLASVVIPDSVTSIGDQAFAWCDSLTSVYITDIAAWCNISFGSSSANPLRYAGNLYLNGTLLTKLIIPNSIAAINDYAFYGCESLTDITIGNSVTSIGDRAFYNCNSLTSIVIPDSVTSIGDEAFCSCDSLTSVTFKNTSGWYVSTSSTATSGTKVTVTNASTAAQYLRSTYCDRYWKRK